MAKSNAEKLVVDYFKLDSVDKEIRKELIQYTKYFLDIQNNKNKTIKTIVKKLQLADTYLSDGANDSALRVIRECESLINNL